MLSQKVDKMRIFNSNFTSSTQKGHWMNKIGVDHEHDNFGIKRVGSPQPKFSQTLAGADAPSVILKSKNYKTRVAKFKNEKLNQINKKERRVVSQTRNIKACLLSKNYIIHLTGLMRSYKLLP